MIADDPPPQPPVVRRRTEEEALKAEIDGTIAPDLQEFYRESIGCIRAGWSAALRWCRQDRRDAEGALREIKAITLTATDGRAALSRILRICIDAGISETLHDPSFAKLAETIAHGQNQTHP